ncbi:MAG: hypothetical protein EXS36_01405 [Pedosphaera sp.]|nr:hypothetical protein [Pedosphaera sp.]
MGWKLVGRDGFNCIACHPFAKLGSTGVPALSHDTMAHRLQWIRISPIAPYLYEHIYVLPLEIGAIGGIFTGLARAPDGAFYGYSNNGRGTGGGSSYGSIFRTAIGGGGWGPPICTKRWNRRALATFIGLRKTCAWSRDPTVASMARVAPAAMDPLLEACS